MEKIYLLCFTKGDFITESQYTTENDGGGYVILASRHLEFLQMRMREEVNKFIERRVEFLKKIEQEEDWIEYCYEDIEQEVEKGYWKDGMGWEIYVDGAGWGDKPNFYIKEIEIS